MSRGRTGHNAANELRPEMLSPLIKVCRSLQDDIKGRHLFSGVATGWTGLDMSTSLLLEVAPDIDTNPTSFYRGGVPPPPDPRYWLALSASHVCPPHIFRPGDAPEPIEMLFGGRLAWTYGTMH